MLNMTGLVQIGLISGLDYAKLIEVISNSKNKL